MYHCPTCSGIIEFNILEQKLRCNSCGNLYEIGQIHDPNVADAHLNNQTDYTAYVYTCSNCGGEMIGTDDSEVGFCTYCGYQSYLEPKVISTQKPQKIIPFQITKEHCQNIYERIIKKHKKTLPDELLNDGVSTEFRGIYIPYTNPKVKENGVFNFTTTSTTSTSSRRYIKKFNFGGTIDAEHETIIQDTSQALDDGVADNLEPFYLEYAVPFHENYLAGFYAEKPTVDPRIYDQRILFDSTEKTFESISHEFPGMMPDNDKVITKDGGKKHILNAIEDVIDQKVVSHKAILLPFWFLTYKNGDRVWYTIINGQTGKAYCELPISIKKILTCMAIISIIMFIILQFITTIPAKSTLGFVAIISSLVYSLCYLFTNRLSSKETHANDPGYFKAMSSSNNIRKRKKKINRLTISIIVSVGLFLSPIWSLMLQSISTNRKIIHILAAICISFIVFSKGRSMKKRILWIDENYSFRYWNLITLRAWIPLLTYIVITIINPPNDMIYYGCSILYVLLSMISMIFLLKNYNLLTSNSTPHFEKEGLKHNA